MQYSPRVHAVIGGVRFVGVRAQTARPDSMRETVARVLAASSRRKRASRSGWCRGKSV
jgi:hypothetical protein